MYIIHTVSTLEYRIGINIKFQPWNIYYTPLYQASPQIPRLCINSPNPQQFLNSIFSTSIAKLLSKQLYTKHIPAYVQGDQLNMAVCFWYLVNSDCPVWATVHPVQWASQFLKCTRKTRLCITGHNVVNSFVKGGIPVPFIGF